MAAIVVLRCAIVESENTRLRLASELLQEQVLMLQDAAVERMQRDEAMRPSRRFEQGPAR
jgi:hypothetical protein